MAELPFGKGRAIGSGWSSLVDALLGGWQISNNLMPTSSNFGKLTNLDSSTIIRPRDIQLGAKISF